MEFWCIFGAVFLKTKDPKVLIIKALGVFNAVRARFELAEPKTGSAV